MRDQLVMKMSAYFSRNMIFLLRQIELVAFQAQLTFGNLYVCPENFSKKIFSNQIQNDRDQ